MFTMPSKMYSVAQQDLSALVGDILGAGILKKGLSKAGATPENATTDIMMKVFDTHVEPALVSFLGPIEAHKYVMNLKRKCLNAGA